MIEQPVIETSRLRLRPVELSDASAIQIAACARDIVDTMISLPHPSPPGEGEQYIVRRNSLNEKRYAPPPLR
jgi:hypothetical protein